MKYQAPQINDKPYYVPIVVKNKDYLIGYIHAMTLFKSIIKKSLNQIGLDIDLDCFDNCLDSTRFNDIMANDKRIVDFTDEEYIEYLKDMIERKKEKITSNHPDNKVDDVSLLRIDCTCGLGFYSFNKIEDIPDKSFRCNVCGRIILDYTNHYDTEYEYDGGEDYENY